MLKFIDFNKMRKIDISIPRNKKTFDKWEKKVKLLILQNKRNKKCTWILLIIFKVILFQSAMKCIELLGTSL